MYMLRFKTMYVLETRIKCSQEFPELPHPPKFGFFTKKSKSKQKVIFDDFLWLNHMQFVFQTWNKHIENVTSNIEVLQKEVNPRCHQFSLNITHTAGRITFVYNPINKSELFMYRYKLIEPCAAYLKTWKLKCW